MNMGKKLPDERVLSLTKIVLPTSNCLIKLGLVRQKLVSRKFSM